MKFILSENAEHKLEEIIDYLYDEWGQQAKESFIIKLAKSIDIISKQPKSSPESKEKPTLRRRKVVKQISLFYVITMIMFPLFLH